MHLLLMQELLSGVDRFTTLRVRGNAVRLYESLWQDRQPVVRDETAGTA